MDDPSIREMAIVPIISEWRIWPPAIVKSRYLGYKSLMNMSLLLVNYRDAHELRYQVPLGACILVSFTMFAIPGWKSSG